MMEALWAKKEEKDGVMYWLPLRVHLEDTGRIMGLMWEHWLSEGQKRLVSVDTDIGKQIAVFIGAIHDIGKASPAFQLKRGFANSKDLDIELVDKLVENGFIGIDSQDLLASLENWLLSGNQQIIYSNILECVMQKMGYYYDIYS